MSCCFPQSCLGRKLSKYFNLSLSALFCELEVKHDGVWWSLYCILLFLSSQDQASTSTQTPRSPTVSLASIRTSSSPELSSSGGGSCPSCSLPRLPGLPRERGRTCSDNVSQRERQDRHQAAGRLRHCSATTTDLHRRSVFLFLVSFMHASSTLFLAYSFYL